MNHRFSAYEPFKGPIPGRNNGSLISMEGGPCTAYALDKLQDRGTFFIEPGDELYGGQVIGENSRDSDIVVNVQKGKKLTNMRASGSDDNAKIHPPKKFSLEESMEYIQKDEYLEITPKSIRMRKIYLDENERGRMAKKED
jgi:GTP-binding protein